MESPQLDGTTRDRLQREIFLNTVEKLFTQNRGSNYLLPIQRRALSHLQKQETIIIVQCDKT